jgi:glycosyltransferase involved in cell wall biosynthesis
VGRLSREKGVDIFLESFAQIASRLPTVSAVVIGDGKLKANLQAQAKRLNLGDRVVFTGNVDDMATAYDALDLMVIPSRSEGLPSAFLEALQSDLPVVSTNVGAMTEIAIVHPGAIDLVPPERPDLLAVAIESALDQEDGKPRQSARRRVVEALSPEVRCQQMIQVYERTVARSQGY